MSAIDLNPPRGMRDFLPKDWVFREKLMNAFNEVSHLNGFLHYETPVVDSYDLFERKAGEEISEQLYDFNDKSNRHLSLRAELTPSMVRLFAGHKETLPYPAKLYSIGQCFRYERATKGRKREHYQWNLDILGEKSVKAELWILKTAIQVMNRLGLDETDFQIHVSSRALLSGFLTSLGLSEETQPEVMIVIDKKDKIPAEVFHEMLTDLHLEEETIQKIVSFLDKKKPEEIKPLVTEHALDDLEELFQSAKELGIDKYIQIDTAIIRGLSYYTGIVFEAFDTKREFRAIFGGGRYDHLFDKMTGKDIPACGLGFGDVVIEELCAAKFGRAETFSGIQLYVGAFSDDLLNKAFSLAKKATESGISTDILLASANPKKFFTQANKRRADYALYLAPEEAEKGTFIIKKMETGEQKIFSFTDDFSTFIKE